MVRLHGTEIAMFSVMPNVSNAWFCLIVRQVGIRAHLYQASISVGAKIASRWTVVIFPNWLKVCAVYIIFILFLFVESRPSFTATPPNPFYVLEGNNITFVWQYNLSGTFDRVVFRFISSSPSRTIVIKRDINLDAGVPNGFYQGRIQENINATRSEITIFALQRSESGEYEIEVTNSNLDPASDKMTVQVQCK